MKSNDSLQKIAELMDGAKSILFLSHVIADGDTIGSCTALCHAMGDLGKIAHICVGETLPNNLEFLLNDSFKKKSQLLPVYDVVVAVDCSDKERFPGRESYFQQASTTINLDHHKTNDFFCDYNYVDPDAAATGEIVYHLIQSAKWTMTKAVAESLYVAIVTDTGQFQYSNTTAKTHCIIVDLYSYEIDRDKINIALYQSERKEKLISTATALLTTEFIAEGKIACAYITQRMLRQISADIQDTDGIVERLRDVAGVEVAIFIKETAPDIMKVGFRSKQYVDVSEITSLFGGGGHARAAGCSINGSVDHAKEMIYPAVIAKLNETSFRGGFFPR